MSLDKQNKDKSAVGTVRWWVGELPLERMIKKKHISQLGFAGLQLLLRFSQCTCIECCSLNWFSTSTRCVFAQMFLPNRALSDKELNGQTHWHIEYRSAEVTACWLYSSSILLSTRSSRENSSASLWCLMQQDAAYANQAHFSVFPMKVPSTSSKSHWKVTWWLQMLIDTRYAIICHHPTMGGRGSNKLFQYLQDQKSICIFAS